MIAPARQAAYEITRQVDAGDADLARALAERRDHLPSQRDRALATEIAVGTQRWRGQLDFLLAAAAGRPLMRLDAEVLSILRLSAYQLRHLARVPASAVVNDAVALTKAARKRSAAGLVNAVLRRVATAPAALPASPTAVPGSDDWRAQAIACLSITHSHPAWLVERWLDRHGWEAALAWVQFNNQPATVTLWPAAAAAGQTLSWPESAPTHWVPGGRVLDGAADALPWLRGPLAFAQDEASAVVAAVAAAAVRSPVLDACAAPGGKTLALDVALPPSARLVAADLRPARVRTLQTMVEQAAGRPVPVIRADAAALPFAGGLGSVLLDAPCSGLGTLRRDPDLRWRRGPDDLERLAAAQHRMVVDAMRAVGRDGMVVYATCSSEPEENEALVAGLAADTGWIVAPADALALPGRVASLVSAEGWVRTLPHRHQLDAFFVAVLAPRPGRSA